MIEDDDDARPLEKEERRSPRRRKDGLDAWIWIAALLGGEKRERHTQAHSKASLENNHGPIFLAVVDYFRAGLLILKAHNKSGMLSAAARPIKRHTRKRVLSSARSASPAGPRPHLSPSSGRLREPKPRHEPPSRKRTGASSSRYICTSTRGKRGKQNSIGSASNPQTLSSLFPSSIRAASSAAAAAMARKRKTDAAPRLDEADRTLYSTFCGAANSLSQLYTQAMAQQKLSFQAGERHALVRTPSPVSCLPPPFLFLLSLPSARRLVGRGSGHWEFDCPRARI